MARATASGGGGARRRRGGRRAIGGGPARAGWAAGGRGAVYIYAVHNLRSIRNRDKT